MVKKPYQLVWTKRSEKNMFSIYKYISKDSPQNAAKVINAIVTAVEKATGNPEIYAPDKYKRNNDGSYRAFEKYHYRLTYRFSKTIIRVLRVRHTSMEPKDY
ncbi:MAG: type II toxin-antitoxin system RelE/ParE family toxin [Sphingobacteriales bacterium]|nr:type II toxin-antitoxin system RelE/ParE family toxin [Sphingobacteriales bacterium]